MMILLGIVLGLILPHNRNVTIEHGFDTSVHFINVILSPEVFFVYILPPIIFEAGFDMPRAQFKTNIIEILIYAIVGTLCNAFSIGLSLWGIQQTTGFPNFPDVEKFNLVQFLLFGSIISAVDPVAVLAVFDDIHVNVNLYILVFGESLLNDGIAVVLYQVFEEFMALGSDNMNGKNILLAFCSFFVVSGGGILIGITVGFLTAFLTKHSHHIGILEVPAIYLLPYFGYLIAELFQFSALLSIMASGFILRTYAERNLHHDVIVSIETIAKSVAYIAEMIIFLMLGIVTVLINWERNFNAKFVLSSLAFCLIFRSVFTVMLTSIMNTWRNQKISWKDQFIMSVSGLRGGIAFSLMALSSIGQFTSEDSKEALMIAVLIVVFFTSFVQGTLAGPLVNFFHIEKEEKSEDDHKVRTTLHHMMLKHLNDGIDAIAGSAKVDVVGKVRRINHKISHHIDPIFVKNYDQNTEIQRLYEVWNQEIQADLEKMTHIDDPDKPIDHEKLFKMFNQKIVGHKRKRLLTEESTSVVRQGQGFIRKQKQNYAVKEGVAKIALGGIKQIQRIQERRGSSCMAFDDDRDAIFINNGFVKKDEE